MHGSLFVPHQHVLYGALLVEGVVDVEHRTTGISPDVLDVFCFETLDECFGSHEHGNLGGRLGGCRLNLSCIH
jgi:hypothetical protein